MAPSTYFKCQQGQRELLGQFLPLRSRRSGIVFMHYLQDQGNKRVGNSKSAAKQISEIYKSSCLAHHATSVSIAEKYDTQITGLI